MTKVTASAAAAAAMACACACAVSAQAATVPFGVQNDVSVATVTGDWGWSLNYQGGYSEGVNISTLFAGIDANDWVMVAAKRADSDTIDVLGAARLAEVTTYTGLNAPHVANGVGWYFNGLSMGFAGATDAIHQEAADIAGIDERDRLSWDTSFRAAGDAIGYGVEYQPLSLFYGYRSGPNISLQDDWTRLVFTLDSSVTDAGAVPEPATWALMILGFAGAGASLRHRRRFLAARR